MIVTGIICFAAGLGIGLLLRLLDRNERDENEVMKQALREREV